MNWDEWWLTAAYVLGAWFVLVAGVLFFLHCAATLRDASETESPTQGRGPANHERRMRRSL